MPIFQDVQQAVYDLIPQDPVPVHLHASVIRQIVDFYEPCLETPPDAQTLSKGFGIGATRDQILIHVTKVLTNQYVDEVIWSPLL